MVREEAAAQGGEGRRCPHLLSHNLGVRIKGAAVVGNVLLNEALAATQRMGFVILVDASAGVVGHVDTLQVASVDQIHRSNDIRATRTNSITD